MTGWAATTDTNSLALEARKLWERGRRESGSSRVELYVKRATRRRVSRERVRDRSTVSDSIETGCAMRWVDRGASVPLHAAIVGTSGAELDRAVRAATVDHDADMGTFADERLELPDERFDLDPTSKEPEAAGLSERMRGAPWVEWVELGVTVEVLVGSGGWIAVRARTRSSALVSGGARLLACRGFDVLSELEKPEVSAEPRGQSLVLAPSAAAAVVTRLVPFAHGPAPGLGRTVGSAWTISDEPRDPRGLAGGEFDDAGFPTQSRALAREGRIVAGIDGPGCYWRRSFRDLPRSLPSTLVVDGVDASTRSEPGEMIQDCRVLPLGRRTWVLELPGTRLGYLRIDPDSLLRGCTGVVGVPEMTAEGVITPGLIFDDVGRG
jgi:hypothetical protein